MVLIMYSKSICITSLQTQDVFVGNPQTQPCNAEAMTCRLSPGSFQIQLLGISTIERQDDLQPVNQIFNFQEPDLAFTVV